MRALLEHYKSEVMFNNYPTHLVSEWPWHSDRLRRWEILDLGNMERSMRFVRRLQHLALHKSE